MKKKRFSSVFGKKKPKIKPASTHPAIIVAEAFEGLLSKAILDGIASVKANIPLDELTSRIAKGDKKSIPAITKWLDIKQRLIEAFNGAGLRPGQKSLQEALQDTYRAGAKRALTELDKIPIKKAKSKVVPKVGTTMSFNLTNQRSVDWLDKYEFDLVDGISDDVVFALQNSLLDAFQNGISPSKIAKEIRNYIGMNQQQSTAAANYRDMLESGNSAQLRDTLSRALRDGRYDSTVLNAANGKITLSTPQIDKMVDSYVDRSVNYRANTIARTESLRASNAGQKEIWQQAQDQGLLSANARQIWIATEDCCDICQDLADDEDGIPLDDTFETDDDSIDGPPAHPNCRCTVGLVTT